MANETTITPTTDLQEKDIPFWMIIVWCVAGFLIVVIVVVAIYYSFVNCCLTKKRKTPRPSALRGNYPMDNYPQGFTIQLHHGYANPQSVYRPSFVDRMRIPRAMEIKMVEAVNSISHSNHLSHASPSLSPRGGNKEYFSAEMFSFNIEEVAAARKQSFRYSNFGGEESKERIHREKLLVTELREKLGKQRQVDEY